MANNLLAYLSAICFPMSVVETWKVLRMIITVWCPQYIEGQKKIKNAISSKVCILDNCNVLLYPEGYPGRVIFSEYMLFVYSCQLTALAEFSTHQTLSQTYLYKAHDEISLLHLLELT